ncbi:MAG: hypothetical protein E6R03_17700 [Hyphomicrobiaceae bacterium]|nr:MAG: hypothetical protein E6R03_17700 [Hyphomicrobiaceae bacterium]
MIPLKKKNEAWKKDCMDVLEAIGRNQYYSSAGLIENYEMVRGRFIYSHYLEREDYADMVNQLTREFDIPSHLRHYDITSQVINTLSGEYQKRPDVFRVKASDEGAINNYVQQKTDLLINYVKEQLDNSIAQRMAQQGMDPNSEDPQVAQARKAMTPPEIERYMKTSWMDAAEIWAENQLLYDRQRFNLPEKEKVEFEDMLVADRCFRHFYLTSNGYAQETWNPVNTFYHKSPEVNYIEKGDYVGRVFFLTVPEIINRYGHIMTEDEILSLEEYKKESYNAKSSTGETTYSGLTPNTVVPSWNFPEQQFTVNNLGFDPNNPEIVDMNIMSALGNKSATGDYNRRLFFQVTEAYWMGQRKLGKYVYLDPETGKPTVKLVDETFDVKLIPDVEVRENAFMELGRDEEPNTLTWTWVNQVWKGIKINNRFQAIKEPIYLDVAPNDFQFKGDANIYGAKLPVCGQVFNNRNAESMSLVDLMKPHQIGHNVAMNQLYEIMQREIGRFALMDMNLLPSSKDWGGDRNYEKFMMVARQLGGAPIDSSPSNKAGDHQSFRVIDLDESARMISRTKIAEFFENAALKQVGITPQRLGETQASESATGVEQAVNQSFAQTESHFTNFSNYKRRCLQMNLEIAQYVQSKQGDVSFMYTASDLSRAFIKLAGIDMLLSEFGVFVEDSQEVSRQLNMLRQLFMENNTVGATPPDLATVIMSNSPAEIRAQLKASYEQTVANQQAQQSAEQQMQQQAQQAASAEADKQRAFEAQQNELDRANERYIHEISAMGYAKNTDVDANGIPDVLEIQKFDLEQDKHSEDILFKRQQQMHEARKENRKMNLEERRINLDKKTLEHQTNENEKDRELEREKIKSQEKIARNKPKPKTK